MKKIWLKFKSFFTEKHIIWIMIIFVIVTIAAMVLLSRSNKNMVEYTERFATQQTLDSIQRQYDIDIKNYKLEDSMQGVEIWGLRKNDSFIIFDINKNRKEFEIFKNKEYDKINSIDKLGSHELQREYAEFK